MKKIAFWALATLFSLPFVACSDSNEEPGRTDYYLIPAYNHFSAVDGTPGASVNMATYKFALRFPGETITFSSGNLQLPGGSPVTFSVDNMPFSVENVKVDNTPCEWLRFAGEHSSSQGSTVASLTGALTDAAYAPDFNIDGYERLVPSNLMHYAVMQYDLNSRWRIRTFWPDVTFGGTTITRMPSSSEPYSNSAIRYRVVMHLDAAPTAYTADVILYNASFAPQMPTLKAIVLKNLSLTFDETGYYIEGANVAPYMYEAGQLLETPKFTINEFRLTCGGNLTSAAINYKVMGVYSGSFEGSWLVSGDAK